MRPMQSQVPREPSPPLTYLGYNSLIIFILDKNVSNNAIISPQIKKAADAARLKYKQI